MSKISKRLDDIRSAGTDKIPSVVASDLTNQFIADIHEKAKKEADEEIKEMLVKSAENAETESLTSQIESLTRENESLSLSLEQAKSQAVQLNDLVKALRADVSQLSKPIEPCGHPEIIAEREGRIRDLEAKILELKPAPPQIMKPNEVPVSFNFEPVRNENGGIRNVVATPVYRN